MSIWSRILRLPLVSAAMLCLTLSGCAPPVYTSDDSGHTISRVTAHPLPQFTTVDQDGAELKQSHYPLGRFGGTFYASSLGGGPKTFNPLVAKDATSSSIGGLLWIGLTESSAENGEDLPHLAKSVELGKDQLTYIVTLRKGLRWSDGKPITADDVVFTWNNILLQGLGNPSTRDILMIDGRLPEVSKQDNLTIVFKTPKPFAPFKNNLSSPILPKHIVAPIIRGNPQAFDSLWGVSAKPSSFVVSGPFMLDEYLSGQRVVLKRNPRYFVINTQGKRLPYLDRYVISFVQDQNAEMLQFQQGRVDMVSVPGKDVFYVKHLQSPDFRMIDLGPSSGTTFLTFNLNPRKSKLTGKPYVNPVKSAWFRDVNFRKAVDWAIRRDQIVQNILMGIGAPLYTAESLSSVYLNPKLAKGHPADLKSARGFLTASGFTWDKTGRLHDKHGNPVVFELLTNAGNLERESVGVSIKEDLNKLGITVNFKPIEFNVLVGKLDTMDWEAIILALTGSPIEPHGGKNVWDSQGALHLFNQRNPRTDMPGSDRLEPFERKLDSLFNAGASTLDREKRKAIYHEYQQVVYDNLPLIYLYSPNSIMAVRTRLQNFDPTPLGSLHNLESIWVKD